MPIKSWSTTDADNDDADLASGLDYRENWNPAQVNNSMRALMTQVKKWWDDVDGGTYSGGTAGGTGNAHTLTFTNTVQTLQAGMRFAYLAPGSATSTVTLNVDGQGAKALQWRGSALASGDITSGDLMIVYYDGTQFQLVLPPRVTATFSTSLNSLTTDATIGAMGDFIPFVDVSDSNASNKGTVQDFLTNIMANMTADTTGGATGDKLMFSDASESNAAQVVTVDNLFINALQLLTTDATGGVLSDLIPFVDASESNAGNKVTVELLIANSISGGTDLTSPESNQSLYQFLARKTDGANIRRVTLNQVGVGKQTVWVPAAAMTSRTTNGAATGTTESTTNKVMNKVLDFDTTTQEFAQFTIAFPKNWNGGTVTFIPYWTAASGTGGVVFGLAGVAVSNDDVIDAAFGTAQTSTDTLIATTDVHVGPESSAITIAGTPAEGDIVYFQINRTVANASDTLAADARLIGIKLIYTTNANTDD